MDILEESCDEVLAIKRSPFTALSAAPPLITTPQKRPTQKRLDDAGESAVKRARTAKSSPAQPSPAQPSPAQPSPAPPRAGRQPSQRPAMTTAPTAGATGVSAVAHSQRPNSRCHHRSILNRAQSIPDVCFAHSCPPKSEKGDLPDGEQSDDETHQARHGRCAKLAQGKKCYPRCEICKDIHQCPRCTYKLQLPVLQRRASFEHNGCTFTWITERKRSWGEVGAWAVFCATI